MCLKLHWPSFIAGFVTLLVLMVFFALGAATVRVGHPGERGRWFFDRPPAMGFTAPAPPTQSVPVPQLSTTPPAWLKTR